MTTAPMGAGALLDACDRSLRHAPVPNTVSAEAQHLLRAGIPLPEAVATTLAEHREICEKIQREVSRKQLREYAVKVRCQMIADVPVQIFTPARHHQPSSRQLLLNAHGGGFTKDSGSLSENIPVACLTGSTVVAVLYRLAPENPFPAAVEDVVNVYCRLLESGETTSIALYGTSAGAILSAQTVVRLQQLQLPPPVALGFFTGTADLSTAGDSEYFFPLIDDPRPVRELLADYIGATDTRDPRLSPIFSNLMGFPPTLCICGTRDLMLSQTTRFHRELQRSGVASELVVFEGMPHAHWSYLDIPESVEAFEVMATFFRKRLALST